MFVFTGEKSYISTDYDPARDYVVVEFTDGNEKKWHQLGYRGWWGWCWLNSIGHTEYCDMKSPMVFESEQLARAHLGRERDWLDRKERAERVTARVIA